MTAHTIPDRKCSTAIACHRYCWEPAGVLYALVPALLAAEEIDTLREYMANSLFGAALDDDRQAIELLDFALDEVVGADGVRSAVRESLEATSSTSTVRFVDDNERQYKTLPLSPSLVWHSSDTSML